jgi:acyl-coenzyme A synthetase/AMP-(fatty) acid ligase
MPGVEVRTVDASGADGPRDVAAGELWVKRSVRSMKAYVPGTEGGGSRWIGDHFALGDVASIDADGFVEVLGRVDDFVHFGGARIHPAEIENVLLSVPGVREAAFVCHGAAGSPERRSRAYVVLDPERPADMESIRLALRDQLPPNRWPDEVVEAERLPRTPNGKLHRRMLASGELETG